MGARVFAHDDETLAKVARAARESGLLALDTEFMREKTYYASTRSWWATSAPWGRSSWTRRS
jgi:hypothetical protein